MAKTVRLDVRGKKCPIPTLMMSNVLMRKELDPGDTLVVTADCPTFAPEVKIWCEIWKKVLVSLREEGASKIAEVLF